MSEVRDPVARRIAAIALVAALLALVMSAYAVNLGLRYLDDVQTLGDTIQEADREVPIEERTLVPPAPALAE